MVEEQPDNIYWERLQVVMKYAGITVTNAFARNIGLKRPENLYQIKRGKLRISRKLAAQINAVYPVFSIMWLLYGDPFTSRDFDSMAEINGIEKIPFYDDLLSHEISNLEPSRFLYLQNSVSGGAEVATILYDDVHAGPLPGGTHLLLKQHTGDIIYGNIYLLEVKGDKLIRIIKEVPENWRMLRLTTARPSVYDDLVVRRKSVTPLYMVCGTITKFCK